MLSMLGLALSPFLIPTASALRVTQDSPCLKRCGDNPSNTTVEEVVCRDNQFHDDPVGTQFKDCVECELESEHFITESGESDVEWGFYNLRFAFSACIYGVPAEKQALSTPCQVSCQDLEESITYRLEDPTGFTTYDFCSLSSFPDSVVTQCAACYNLTVDETYLANFIEAIREGCHSRVPAGSPFILDPTRIFNEELIPPNTESITAENPDDDDGGGKPDNLVLIIVLPIVGFLVIVACLGVGCFFLVRRRRRKAKRNSQSDHLHERWNDTSIITPMPGGMGKEWNGDRAQPQAYSVPGSPHSGSVYGGHQSFYQPEYHGGVVQQGDIAYPSEAYIMDQKPSSPLQNQHQQFSPSPPPPSNQYQHQYQPEKYQQYLQQQHPHLQASVPSQDRSRVPVLADPPPPRKSLSKREDGH